ncbi:hypothetical protein R3I94_018283 [Phoxinus phoxinus]
MMIGCCFICVFAVLINKVSLQKNGSTVKAVIGGSVLLPCSSTEHDLELQDFDVLWRHNDSETVYDLIKGQDSVAGQNQRYKNRTETFSKEYEKGNFSLKLINLQYTDAGEFTCYITHPSYPKQEIVQLLINESTEQENQGPETQPSKNIIIVISVCIVIVIVIMASLLMVKFFKRKITQGHLYRDQGHSLFLNIPSGL